jgi:hypothetical protein
LSFFVFGMSSMYRLIKVGASSELWESPLFTIFDLLPFLPEYTWRRGFTRIASKIVTNFQHLITLVNVFMKPCLQTVLYVVEMLMKTTLLFSFFCRLSSSFIRVKAITYSSQILLCLKFVFSIEVISSMHDWIRSSISLSKILYGMFNRETRR